MGDSKSHVRLIQSLRVHSKADSAFCRTSNFTKDISNRFYHDSSLDSQSRALQLLKSRKKKQDMHRWRQEQKLTEIQENYEMNKIRLEQKQLRLKHRIQCRKEFNAAIIIQLTWSQYLKRCHILYEQNCAARIIQNFIANVALDNRCRRRKAAQQIQKAWGQYIDYQIQWGASVFIQQQWHKCILKIRHQRCQAASKIQRLFVARRSRLRRNAASIIQKLYRHVRYQRKQKKLAALYLTLQKSRSCNAAARKIQKLFGIHLVRRRIRQEAEKEAESEEDTLTTASASITVSRLRPRRSSKPKLTKQDMSWIKYEPLKLELNRGTRLNGQIEQELKHLEEMEKKIIHAQQSKEAELKKRKRMIKVEHEKDMKLLEDHEQQLREFEETTRREIRKELELRQDSRRRQSLRTSSSSPNSTKGVSSEELHGLIKYAQDIALNS